VKIPAVAGDMNTPVVYFPFRYDPGIEHKKNLNIYFWSSLDLWSDIQYNAEEKRPATASTGLQARCADASNPADRCEQDVSRSDKPKPTETESTAAMRKGDGTEKTEQELVMEDTIRLTRAKLKKRAGIGHGPDSGPNTPK
jgi:hypothetical protein